MGDSMVAHTTAKCRRRFLPLEQEELGAEGRSHGSHHAVAAGAPRLIAQEVLHDGEDRCGREVSPLTQAVVGCRERMLGEIQRGFHGLEDLWPTAVKDEAADVVDAEIDFFEKVLDGVAELGAYEFGNVSGEDNVEAAVVDVPAHKVLGVRIEGGASGDDARAGPLDAGGSASMRCFVAGEDDGRGAVSEEPGGDDIGHGEVILLPSKGAEFNGEKDGVLVGEGAEIIHGAGDTCGTGDAAEAEDGCALYVLGEAHQVDETGIDAGAGDAGDGGEEDRRDVSGSETCLAQGVADGTLTKLHGALDPEIIGGAKAREGAQSLEGKHDVAIIHSTIRMQTIHNSWSRKIILHTLFESLCDDRLGIAVFRKCRAYGCNAHGFKDLLENMG